MCPLAKAEKRLSDCAEFLEAGGGFVSGASTFVRNTQATIRIEVCVLMPFWRERHTIYAVRGVTFESPDRLNCRGKDRAFPENDQKDDHRSLHFGISYSKAYRLPQATRKYSAVILCELSGAFLSSAYRMRIS